MMPPTMRRPRNPITDEANIGMKPWSVSIGTP